MQDVTIQLADYSHLKVLLPLVRAYHEFEKIAKTDAEREQALIPLLIPQSNFGRIWLITCISDVVGYIALCFGYSVEFGGRDAFIDELFIVEKMRGRGCGSAVLQAVKQHAGDLGVKALHLEVAKTNKKAQRFYDRLGFRVRGQFQLMSCPLAVTF